jgi:hypothetical protein
MLHYIAGWSHRAAGDAARGMNSGQRSKRNGARRISGSGQTAPINDKIIMLTYNNDGSCGFLIDITLISQTERTSYRAGRVAVTLTPLGLDEAVGRFTPKVPEIQHCRLR